MLNRLLIFSVLIFLIGCSNNRTLVVIDGVENEIYRPPGTIEIKENVYVDEFELSNIDYREYLSWLDQVHGKNSMIYKNAYPDLSVWQSANEALKGLEKEYFSNPAYDYYPVVGISLEQARDYTKWRTDRVAEMILTLKAYIEPPKELAPATHFTIERYLLGTYKWVLKKEKKRTFPVYSIPTEKEWTTYVAADLEAQILQDKELKNNKRILNRGGNLYNIKQQGSIQEKGPMLRLGFGINDNGLTHVIGNVSEMTTEGIARGGNWKESLVAIIENDRHQFEKANYFTGFRNICQWKQLGKQTGTVGH